MANPGLGPLVDGGRAVIIGGGPGGTATAISLKQKARALGLDIRVAIVEGKQFVSEQHHNQCVGVLSPPITEVFESKLEIPFPHWLVRDLITGYVLHTARREIVLEGNENPSLALRRIQFDAFMLNAARERGVEVISARATGLEFHDDRVVIYTENLPLEAEVVVGAFGLDEGTASLFKETVGYLPPPSLNSIVTKYHPGETGMAQFGNRIHAFLPPNPQIEFGGITPKGNHLTINIAGARVDSSFMDKFISSPEVSRYLPYLENAGRIDKSDLRYFKGRFPCGLARSFTGDRYVMVGDAAGLVRAFKGKGVTSAIQTGQRAAEVILYQGISAGAMRAYHKANRDITDDLPYGQAIRLLTIFSSHSGLMNVYFDAAQKDSVLREALFDAVSAHHPYREVVSKVISPNSIKVLALALARSVKLIPLRTINSNRNR